MFLSQASKISQMHIAPLVGSNSKIVAVDHFIMISVLDSPIFDAKGCLEDKVWAIEWQLG